jgi:NADPH-dependent 7-cyano-7-deazaguanine reductase QueF-like protein
MEVIDPRLRKKSARDNDLYKGNYYNNLPQVGNTTTSTEVSSDQLAIVTSKSFHFFSLSFTNTANTKKIVCVDRFVTKLV